MELLLRHPLPRLCKHLTHHRRGNDPKCHHHSLDHHPNTNRLPSPFQWIGVDMDRDLGIGIGMDPEVETEVIIKNLHKWVVEEVMFQNKIMVMAAEVADIPRISIHHTIIHNRHHHHHLMYTNPRHPHPHINHRHQVPIRIQIVTTTRSLLLLQHQLQVNFSNILKFN